MPTGHWSEDAELALLAGRTRDGNESAFEELVRRVHGRVRQWAWRLTDDHDEADDVAQLVLVKLHARAGEFERTGREARQTVLAMCASGGSTDLVTAVGQAAQSFATHSEITFSFNVKGRARSIRADVYDVAVSIVQEAMTNVLKHAHARGVKLSVRFETRSVRLSVRDDGQGLLPDEGGVTDAGHFGLVGMRERRNQCRGQPCRIEHTGQRYGSPARCSIPRLSARMRPRVATPISSLEAGSPRD